MSQNSDLEKFNILKLDMISTFSEYFNELYGKFVEKNINLTDFIRNKELFVKQWNISRIDIKNTGNPNNSIRFLECDDNLILTSPDWFNDNQGHGFRVVTTNNSFKFKFRCLNDGMLNIRFRGMDFRHILHRNNRIPIKLIFEKIKINNEIILQDSKLLWHDNPLIYSKNCNDGEIIEVEIETSKIYDYFPKLLELCDNIKNDSSLIHSVSMLNNYLENKINLCGNVFNDYLVLDKKFNDLYVENYNLNQKYLDLNNKFNNLETNVNSILDSYNNVFNVIFKYYELNPKKLIYFFHELTKVLLDFVDNVCKKYKFQWWLCSGSLLGAYRHGGFIPWDDDFDISMLRQDYEDFFEIFSKEIAINGLEDNIVIIREKHIRKYTLLPFIKIECRFGKEILSFIDIFPVDYIDEIPRDIKLIHSQEFKKFRRNLIDGMDRKLALNLAFKNLNVSNTKTDKLIGGVERIFGLMEYNDLFPLKKIQFEDRFYPCPNNIPKYLKGLYGEDYMTVPKVIYAHSLFNNIEEIEGIEEIYKKNIGKLQEINNNF